MFPDKRSDIAGHLAEFFGGHAGGHSPAAARLIAGQPPDIRRT